MFAIVCSHYEYNSGGQLFLSVQLGILSPGILQVMIRIVPVHAHLNVICII